MLNVINTKIIDTHQPLALVMLPQTLCTANYIELKTILSSNLALYTDLLGFVLSNTIECAEQADLELFEIINKTRDSDVIIRRAQQEFIFIKSKVAQDLIKAEIPDQPVPVVQFIYNYVVNSHDYYVVELFELFNISGKKKSTVASKNRQENLLLNQQNTNFNLDTAQCFSQLETNFILNNNSGDAFDLTELLNGKTLTQTEVPFVLKSSVDQITLGNDRRALKLLEMTKPHSDSFPICHYLMAITQARLGELDQALEAVKFYLEHNPNNPDGIDLLNQINSLTNNKGSL